MINDIEKELTKSFKEKDKHDRLFNWMKSIIDVDDIPMRRNYVPLYNLLEECLTDGKSWISSNYSDGEEIFTFTIELKKERIKQ